MALRPRSPMDADMLRRAGGATAAQLAYGRRVVPAGDSITAASSTRPNSPNNQWWGKGYAGQALWRSGGRLRGIVNAGIAGNTSTQLLARWQTDVLAYDPDIVLLMIGTNDIPASDMSGAQIATLMGNIEQMVLQAFAANALVVLVTPPTKDGNKADARRIIPYYYRLAEAYRLPLIDMFALTVDPVTGGWKTGLSDDGTHPNAVGEALMAEHAATILSDLPGYRPSSYLAAYSDTSVGNPANLIRNGSFAQQTTPGVPDGWSITATNSTYDVTQDAPEGFTGKEYAFVKSATGSVFYPLIATASIPSLTAGDRLRFTCGFSVEEVSDPSTGYSLALEASQHGGRAFWSAPYEGDFVIDMPVEVEDGYLAIKPYILFASAGTFRVRNLTAINLTAMDAVWAPANGR